MYMNSENDDKETLLPIRQQTTIEELKRKEPFDIEGSIEDTQERPYPIPTFLLNQKTTYEKSKCIRALCCCLHKRYKLHLLSNIKNKELKVYYKLKSLASQPFDEDNSQHKESLKFLYLVCISNETTPDLRTIEWKNIGFQSDNPMTDFRGSGYISLLFMIYFVKQYESEYMEMISYEYFLFAIVCIRIVFMFKIYANLVESDRDMPILLRTHKIKSMTIRQFKIFHRNLIANENYLFELLAKCLIGIKIEYKRQYSLERKEMNFLLIEPIILSCFKIIYDELEN